ncbi:hypothetical protein BDR06DRAFT_996297 [Suillus hirtellus]|nr:hypothetical protein BDR06DRAFT_996297 [Suillus hirtellus]
MPQDLSEYIIRDRRFPAANGGFANIWKCTLHIDRSSVIVAVKEMIKENDEGECLAEELSLSLTLQGATSQMIKHELRIRANLKHANISPVLGYTYGFSPFLAIVSPWAENGDLHVYLRREGEALTLVQRFQLLRDIIAGLHYRM